MLIHIYLWIIFISRAEFLCTVLFTFIIQRAIDCSYLGSESSVRLFHTFVTMVKNIYMQSAFHPGIPIASKLKKLLHKLKLTLCAVSLIVFDKFIISCFHHYSFMKNSFHHSKKSGMIHLFTFSALLSSLIFVNHCF